MGKVQLELSSEVSIDDEYFGTTSWFAALHRRVDDSSWETVATAQARTFDFASERCMFDALDDISQDYADLAFAASESGRVGEGCNPLFVINLVVAPHWRGHNIGPQLLRWIATRLAIGAVFLVPSPLRTEQRSDGVWISDWEAPRGGSGAMHKVRRAYRTGGFTHLRSGVWWSPVGPAETEIEDIRRAMRPLEGVP